MHQDSTNIWCLRQHITLDGSGVGKSVTVTSHYVNIDDDCQYGRMTIFLIIANMEGGSVTSNEGLVLMMYLDKLARQKTRCFSYKTWETLEKTSLSHAN